MFLKLRLKIKRKMPTELDMVVECVNDPRTRRERLENSAKLLDVGQKVADLLKTNGLDARVWGSAVQGTSTPESDVDVVVVSDDPGAETAVMALLGARPTRTLQDTCGTYSRYSLENCVATAECHKVDLTIHACFPTSNYKIHNTLSEHVKDILYCGNVLLRKSEQDAKIKLGSVFHSGSGSPSFDATPCREFKVQRKEF